MGYFTDEFRHPFFHTNNLWFDLEARSYLRERKSVLGLPLIKNERPSTQQIDPRKVIQIETAMGAAIEVFEGATAIGVDRDRFLQSRPPVTCWWCAQMPMTCNPTDV